MKKTMAILITALFLAQNPCFIYAAQNAVVKSVRVSSESVYITTDKPVKYRAFTMGNPPKLIVELDNSTLKTLQDIPVNSVFIHKVRTGQFKTTPVSVARIVLDLTQKAVYDITQKGSELIVVLGGKISTPKMARKDAPAEVKPAATEAVKVIEPSSPAKAKPVAEPLTVKPAKPENAPIVLPRKTAPAARRSKNIMHNLSTEPMDLDYPSAEIRDIINMMAAKANLNIIYSDDVTGTATVNLKKVPFDEAFRIILSVNGLAAQQIGDNILRIAAPATFLAEQKKAFQQTRVFFLNYAKAADVKSQLDSVTIAEKRTASCAIDAVNNALIVTDSATGLENTALLIRDLDRRPKQVMIEVKLVEVVLGSSLDLGVTWTTSTGLQSSADVNKVRGTYKAAEFLGTSGVFRFGNITRNSAVDVALSASSTKGKFKVLSDPKVATLNNQEANITITDQTSYKKETTTIGTAGPTTTTEYPSVTTGITLKVTPIINSDGRITMHLIPLVSQVGRRPTVDAPPDVATRGTDTNVIVKNGETIVIGGLIHDSQDENVTKVPILGDIPLLGWLFKKKSIVRSRKELLIFVTPTILED